MLQATGDLATPVFCDVTMKSLGLLIPTVVTEKREGKLDHRHQRTLNRGREHLALARVYFARPRSVRSRHLPEPSSARTGVNLEMTQKGSWEQTRH